LTGTPRRCYKVPRNIRMPVILLFCIVGAFAINNTVFDIGVMLVAGVVAHVLEENGFPVAPAILGRRDRWHARGDLHHVNDHPTAT